MALLRAVLRNHCASDDAARRHLAEAARLGVDALDYCAHRFGLGSETVWRRAAGWAGFTFAAQTPHRGPLPALRGIEHLGGARTLRQRVLGKDVVFCAPAFERVIALAAAKHLAGHVRFAPPAAIEAGLARAASAQLMDNARQRMTQLWPEASAAVSLPLVVRLDFSIVMLAVLFAAAGVGSFVHPLFGGVLSVLLMLPGLVRLVAAWPVRQPAEPRSLADSELPFYTVLIPLRDETAMVPLLARAMAALDYPPEKLDIKFVVESKSPTTIAAVERLLPDPRFRLVEVPAGPPATKPKALDYALPLARGEFLVVYDAEDVPDPDQLRKAASRFAADPTLACLQAELVPENARENVLTALFAGEYAGLFGRLLPALARWGLPVPLGGTSNHFRTGVLRELGGWDAFNVTEDADLGMRLRRRGLRAEMLASRTLEEAPITLLAWMAQRRRWMKGWMQTFLVHNRAPGQLLRDLGWRAFLGFEVLVGGMIVSALLHTLVLVMLGARLALEGPASLVPHSVFDWLGTTAMVTGYGGTFAIVASGLIRQRAYGLLAMQLLLPVYWVFHAIAALWAVHDLVRWPLVWLKTMHGVTRMAREHAPQGTLRLRPRIG